MGVFELGQDLLPQSLAEKVRVTFQQGENKQPKDVFLQKLTSDIVDNADEIPCVE